MKKANKKYKLTRKQKVQIRIRKIKGIRKGAMLGFTIEFFLFFMAVSFSIATYYRNHQDVQVERSEDTELVIDMVGDIMLGRGIESIRTYRGEDSLYKSAKSYWENADLVAANLENAVLKEDKKEYQKSDNTIYLNSDYHALEHLRQAGVNMFGLANNHAYDYSERAIIELSDYMKWNDIIYSGIGKDREDALHYAITEVNHIRIGFVAITDVCGKEDVAREKHAGVMSTTYGGYNQLVNRISRETDLTIVYMHWGDENQLVPSARQTQLGHQLVEAGADVVIGSHPHVVQRAERYRKGVIFYSLGNFIFDQGNTYSRDTAMVQLEVNKNGRLSFKVIPMRINDGVPMEASEYYAKRINHKIISGLNVGEYHYDQDRHVIIPAFTLRYARVNKGMKGETYTKWENVACVY